MSLSRTTLIAVVAGSAAGLLIVLYVLYRVFRTAEQVPLPPKQELARYREQQTYVVQSHRETWYDARMLSAPPSRSSKSSLVPPESRDDSLFRRPSYNVSEAPSEPSSFDAGGAPMVPALPHPPHMTFHNSSTSLTATETESPSSPPTTESSFSYSDHLSVSPSLRPSRRPRPLSVGSAGSSAISRNSRHTIRGAPHAPHNHIQIVLPSPLAFNDRMSIHESQQHRLSAVDQWTPAAVRSEVPRPRPLSSSGIRRPASQSSLVGLIHTSLPSPHSSHSTRSSPVPPVPQLPQQWVLPMADEGSEAGARKLQKRSRSGG